MSHESILYGALSVLGMHLSLVDGVVLTPDVEVVRVFLRELDCMDLHSVLVIVIRAELNRLHWLLHIIAPVHHRPVRTHRDYVLRRHYIDGLNQEIG